MKTALSVNRPAAPIHAGFPAGPAAPPLARLLVGGPCTAATAPGLRAQLRSYAEQGCVRLHGFRQEGVLRREPNPEYVHFPFLGAEGGVGYAP